jgi:hypothetical protein
LAKDTILSEALKGLPSCSKCSRDTPSEFKYCPYCGSQLSLSFDGILLAKLFGKVEPRKGVHRLAQLRLWTMGKELGFFSTTEYGVPDLTKEGRISYIDVVWKSRNGIEFAFEIRRKIHDLDLVTTIKDTNKLRNLLARKKFVVNISELTGKAYFCEISDEPTPPVSEPIPRMTFELSSKNREQNKAYSIAEIRQRHPRAYQKWTDVEDSELSNSYQDGLSTFQLAERHQRKQGAIRSRLRKLGL